MSNIRIFDVPQALPKTGQTAGQRTGDDATFQAGWPGSPRFVDNGDGTIYDRCTKLTWIKQPELIIPEGPIGAINQVQVARGEWDGNSVEYAVGDLIFEGPAFYVCTQAHISEGFFDPGQGWIETIWTANADDLVTPSTMTWVNAIDNCLGLITCGKGDWRLPNVQEMHSLVNFGANPPIPSATFFPNIKTDAFYWSSTSYPPIPATYAEYIDFASGAARETSKTNARYVLPVRGGII